MTINKKNIWRLLAEYKLCARSIG